MKVIYVAGPFRADNAWDIEQNVRRAEELGLAVWRLGAAAIIPHTNSRFFSGAAPDSVWLEGDLAILAKCDAVILTETWRRSAGARAEEQYARELGLPVFRNLRELALWLDGQTTPTTD